MMRQFESPNDSGVNYNQHGGQRHYVSSECWSPRDNASHRLDRKERHGGLGQRISVESAVISSRDSRLGRTSSMPDFTWKTDKSLPELKRFSSEHDALKTPLCYCTESYSGLSCFTNQDNYLTSDRHFALKRTISVSDLTKTDRELNILPSELDFSSFPRNPIEGTIALSRTQSNNSLTSNQSYFVPKISQSETELVNLMVTFINSF
ncbi:uncharacterized protein LOC126279044 [Schistocerca gregaria]|uniref:uncharacterized protein LOC126279044 n=1 Tax=Schistocerca gregaria TaxID=7010 RepID=UPI00211E4A3D|nr:uncharacterized protein LOC126279044 [Schistocerca gregaria]